MRVFMAEPNGRYDVSQCAEYGDLVYLSQRAMNPFNTVDVEKQLIEALRQHRFNPAADFVCMTGQNLIIAMLLAVAVREYGSVQVLMFDARDSTYRERWFGTPITTLTSPSGS